MTKKKVITVYALILILGVALIVIQIGEYGRFTGFIIFEQESESDFSNGTYENTFYSTLGGFIQLEGQTSGSYTSEVIDVDELVSWNNFSWISNAIGELPDNGMVETMPAGADMNDNVLLMHMNGNVIGNYDIIDDTSGEGNDGTAYGDTDCTVNGKLNNGCSFDGDADYIIVSQSLTTDLVNNFTIAVWVNPDGKSGRIIDNNNQYGIHFNSDRNNIYSIGNGIFRAISLVNSAPRNIWTHITIVFSSSGNKIYINGREAGRDSFSTDVTNHGDLIIASGIELLGSISGLNNFFSGIIDEVVIWDRVLSQEEILDLYKRGVLRLSLDVRSCNDIVCSVDDFVDIGDKSPQNLDVSNNQYFQYRFEFKTDNEIYSPELYNVRIDYDIIEAFLEEEGEGSTGGGQGDEAVPEIPFAEETEEIPFGYDEVVEEEIDDEVDFDELDEPEFNGITGFFTKDLLQKIGENKFLIVALIFLILLFFVTWFIFRNYMKKTKRIVDGSEIIALDLSD